MEAVSDPRKPRIPRAWWPAVLWTLAFASVLGISIQVVAHRLQVAAANHGPGVHHSGTLESGPHWMKPLVELESLYFNPGLTQIFQRIGHKPTVVALLFAPAEAEHMAGQCPQVPPDLAILCDAEQLAALQASIEQVLMDALGDPDDTIAMWALEIVVLMGPEGAVVARNALVAEAARYSLERQRSLAISALARILPEEEAAAVIVSHLQQSGPQAAMAALELARIGDGSSLEALAQAEARLSGSVEGLVVAHARALLVAQDQGSPSP